MSTTWKPIRGYEGIYEVSSDGNVRRINGSKLTLIYNANRVNVVSLSKGSKVEQMRVSKIVAQTFIPNPQNKTDVRHINGITTDDRAINLKWCDRRETVREAYKNGSLNVSGMRNPNSKLTNENIAYIKTHFRPRDVDFNGYALAQMFGVSRGTIYRVVKKR